VLSIYYHLYTNYVIDIDCVFSTKKNFVFNNSTKIKSKYHFSITQSRTPHHQPLGVRGPPIGNHCSNLLWRDAIDARLEVRVTGWGLYIVGQTRWKSRKTRRPRYILCFTVFRHFRIGREAVEGFFKQVPSSNLLSTIILLQETASFPESESTYIRFVVVVIIVFVRLRRKRFTYRL